MNEYDGEGVRPALLALETTHRVILSGAAASRSEAAAQSKDLYTTERSWRAVATAI